MMNAMLQNFRSRYIGLVTACTLHNFY